MTAARTDRMRAWVEVDLAALRRNAERVAQAVEPARVIPMVKADAYGLGAVEVARALVPTDPYAFGVATVDEGVELREAGIDARIIVFAGCGSAETTALVDYSLEAAILGPGGLADLGDAGAVLHVEVDTGMGRAGFDSEAVEAWGPVLERVAANGTRIDSFFTHFHSSGTDAEATRRQFDRFDAALAGLDVPRDGAIKTHMANSDAIRSDRQYHSNLVRPGLYLYGGGRGSASTSLLVDPEPVVSVRARILEVRDLPPGSTVSYGATYVTQVDSRLATLGIGYADGVPCATSNRGDVLVGGERAPMRGRVCMDMTTVDVTEVSRVQAGDVATVLGADDPARIELRDFAERSDTIEYEVLTGLGGRLPRVYLRSEAGSTRDD